MNNDQLAIDPLRINLFRSLFRGRTEVYARYWLNTDTNKSGYSPIYSLNKKSEPLTEAIIHQHLEGRELVGLYPLLSDNTCFFLAIDFDGPGWLTQAVSVINVARKSLLPVYLERSKSGSGGHIWFFFETNIPAVKARSLGKLLLIEAGIRNRHTFDRLFPSQDEQRGKGLGNLIALPLHGQYLKQGNTSFINLEGNVVDDQWNYLASFRKIDESEVDRVLNDDLKSTRIIPESAINNGLVRKEISVEEPGEPEVQTSFKSEARLILGSQIFIPSPFLPDKLYRFLKQNLNFPNPEYIEKQRRGYSTWQTHKFIQTIETADGGILIPAGFLNEIENYSKNHGLSLKIDDRQILKPLPKFNVGFTLRPNQKRTATMLLKHDRAILEAQPGFGKTMVALYTVKRRQQNTLVIVHTRSLLEQWKKQIEKHFELEEDDLDILGEGRWQPGRKITVASYQTLHRRGVDEIKNQYGYVVVDECHHVPAKTLTDVLKNFSAKYVLGLTATAYRKDRLERLMNFYIGEIVKADDQITPITNVEEKVETKLITRKTNFNANLSGSDDNNRFQQLCHQLINNSERNQMIVEDVGEALNRGDKCLILTERVEHCQTLLDLLRKKVKNIQAAIAEGRITRKKRGQLLQRIRQERFQLLIATGKLIGEGFDWPELTHLFLAFPFSWKGKLVQYVGRVQRSCEGKTNAFVYDYADLEEPVLKIMYFRRLRTYRNLGLARQKTAKSRNMASANQLPLL